MRRSFWSLTSLRRIMTITIDVVRLSRMALSTNVMKAMRQSNFRLLDVLIMERTKLKPPFWSTSSTMVMAPIRKNSVVEVLPRWCSITSLTFNAALSPTMPEMYCPGSIMKSVQVKTNMRSAMAALLTFVKLSMAIHR